MSITIDGFTADQSAVLLQAKSIPIPVEIKLAWRCRKNFHRFSIRIRGWKFWRRFQLEWCIDCRMRNPNFIDARVALRHIRDFIDGRARFIPSSPEATPLPTPSSVQVEDQDIDIDTHHGQKSKSI